MPQAATSPRPAAPRPARETHADDAPALLHEFLTRAARRWPEHVAVEAPPSAAHPERRTITYAELDRRSDALAHELREVVAGEGVVAVLLPRNAEHIYLAQIGILKAGAAYTSTDPA